MVVRRLRLADDIPIAVETAVLVQRVSAVVMAADLETGSLHEALAGAGQLALACHLIELAAAAAPDDAGLHAARAAIYRARAATERSLMARGVFTAAAERT